MKKHKIMSLLLAILIMTITVTTSYAQSGNNTQILSQEYINEEDSGQTIYDKNIIESKSDNLFHVEKVGNKIYVDGVHEATVYELSPMINTLDNSTADADILRSGWHYTENCPHGSRSDYTQFITSRNKNIHLEREIASYSSILLGGIIAAGLSIPRTIAVGIAGKILTDLPGTQYGRLKTLYFKEYIYGHKTLPNFYRMNKLLFFFDPNYSEYATTDIKYSWWG